MVFDYFYSDPLKGKFMSAVARWERAIEFNAIWDRNSLDEGFKTCIVRQFIIRRLNSFKTKNVRIISGLTGSKNKSKFYYIERFLKRSWTRLEKGELVASSGSNKDA